MADLRLDGAGERATWFVGATYSGRSDDQSGRFIKEGIWENGYRDKYLELVRSIQPGDRIAIKSTYTRKRGVPFETGGHTVSTMAIKAVGTVKRNHGDGRRLDVDWTAVEGPREWYFYTSRAAVWRVLPGTPNSDDLIRFAFTGERQNLDYFRNAPHWRDRFGDQPKQFEWATFYEAFANALLTYKNRRNELVAGIHDIADRLEGFSIASDEYEDGSKCPLSDICPFTVFGMFNRGITEANRISIARELAAFLGVAEEVPKSFEAIPVLNNMKSWFFSYAHTRKADDIDVLWSIFERALVFADSDELEDKEKFQEAYDIASRRYGVAWNLTIGLYWIRPWAFASLDTRSRSYLRTKLSIDIGRSGDGKRCDAHEYVHLIETLDARFLEDSYPVHSFPELSFAAFSTFGGAAVEQVEDDEQAASEASYLDKEAGSIDPYSIDRIIEDGCFLSRSRLEVILDRLDKKRNLILQGPPGTGKSWLAKRLAYAIVGEKDEQKVRPVQFHPNLSYEDFIRGWRPSGDGRLSLIDGPFMEMVALATKDPQNRYVVVIEEINRGNPAQIFGEMLTLMEADKRGPSETLELSYRKFEGERVSVPTNLFIIGTMNVADRSLAMVDLALRRRFAFIDLNPTFGSPWKNWVADKHNFSVKLLDEIERRILDLNAIIDKTHGLGPQYRIGHSFVTPPTDIKIHDPERWYLDVVDTEIGPLLHEYWFDNSGKAREYIDQLSASGLS